MSKTTISDYIAKDNKTLTFDERAKKFQERLKPMVEELGVMPWAGLQQTQESLVAIPMLRDLWEDSGKE